MCMAQLAIYLEDGLVKEIKKACKQSGLSRSQWIVGLVKKALSEKIPKDFFKTLASWEDNRTPEEIFRDIRRHSLQKDRNSLK